MGENRVIGLTVISLVVLCGDYIKVVVDTPLASNNIYEQQYQMHRFTTEYYKKPVAVNDIGWVSYRNNDYVLDLFGLASLEALKYRQTTYSSDWMDILTKKHDAQLAMIYTSWFREIPPSWRLVARMHLSKTKISAAESAVRFYSLNCESLVDTYNLISQFAGTLPNGVKVELFKVGQSEVDNCV